MEISAHLSVILEVVKDVLVGELVQIKLLFEVTSGKYPMYDELG